MYLLLAGLIGVFSLFSLWFIDKRSDIPKKLSKKHRIIFTVGAVLTVALIMAGAFQMANPKKPSTANNGPAVPAASKVKIDDKSPLQYKVLTEKKEGESLRVTVITPETSDARIIAINDKVYNEFKDKYKSLYIDYFDNEEISKVYFAKITDKKTSNKDKKNLLSHYIALMIANEISGKKLNKVTANNSLLKTY